MVSRVTASGASNLTPCQPSITCGPLVPMPSRNRPPDSSCSDMADIASIAGVRAPSWAIAEPRPDPLGLRGQESQRRHRVLTPRLGHPHRGGADPLGVPDEVRVLPRGHVGGDAYLHALIVALGMTASARRSMRPWKPLSSDTPTARRRRPSCASTRRPRQSGGWSATSRRPPSSARSSRAVSGSMARPDQRSGRDSAAATSTRRAVAGRRCRRSASSSRSASSAGQSAIPRYRRHAGGSRLQPDGDGTSSGSGCRWVLARAASASSSRRCLTRSTSILRRRLAEHQANMVATLAGIKDRAEGR